MKNLLLFITLLFISVPAIQAQDEASYGFAKGDWVLGGAVTFGSSEIDGVETSGSEIAPAIATFISDKWAVGVAIGLESMEVDGNKMSDTNITLGARNYFMDLNDRNKMYFSLGLSFDSGVSFDDGMTSLGAGFGLNYFMTENIIIDFGLANILSYAKSGDNSAMQIGWEGEIANRWASPTLGIIFKL